MGRIFWLQSAFCQPVYGIIDNDNVQPFFTHSVGFNLKFFQSKMVGRKESSQKNFILIPKIGAKNGHFYSKTIPIKFNALIKWILILITQFLNEQLTKCPMGIGYLAMLLVVVVVAVIKLESKLLIG